MKGAIAVLLLAVLQSAMTNAAVDPQTYFPELKSNLTKIVWAHAVNNQAELQKALNSSSVMMLEADVVMGKKINGANEIIPIMAHPPINTSDLTLVEFIDTVNKKNKTAGVKLDFKSIEAFTASNTILKSLNDAKYPVFINADIYAGPVEAGAPNITAEAFMKEAMQYPNVILSLGWTTKLEGSNNSAQTKGYTNNQVDTMIKMLKDKNVKQPITYAVRANLAVASTEQMQKLVNSTDVKNTTLTIWSHDGDAVNATNLSKLIKTVSVNKVYLDVPDSLKSQLNLTDTSGASGITVTTMTLLGSLLVNFFLTAMPRRG